MLRRALLILVLFPALALAQDRKLDRAADAVEAAGKTLDDLKTQLGDAPDDAELQKKVDDAETGLDDAVASLKEKIAVAEERGDDVTKYKKLIVQVTGEINLDDLDAAVALTLVEEWFDTGKTWLKDNGLNILFKSLLFLVILFVFRLIGRVLGNIARRTLQSSRLKVSDLLRSFFVMIVTKTTFLVGLLIALSTVGIDIGPLLAGVGVLGFVVGFALQGTLSNFASGVMILLYRPYDIGDFISAAGITGTVDSMTLVSTTVLTPDNQMVIVPNNSIWGGVITNVTARPTRRVDMTIGIGYGDDIDHAREVIMRVLAAHELVLKDPAPVVALFNLGDSSVDFVVRPWCKTSDYWQVLWDLTKGIKQELDKESISIPFPQSDLHIISDVKQPAPASTEEKSHAKAGQGRGLDEQDAGDDG